MSFEPGAANYFVLFRNIELNRVDDRVSAFWIAFCIAFSDTEKLDRLNMASTEIGGALSTFGSTVDVFGQSFTASFRQGMIGYSIDSFIKQFQPQLPTHIKIDVDGIEGLIISGARQLLQNPILKSVFIELDDHREDEIQLVAEIMVDSGFKLKHKKHAPMFDGGLYASCFNHLYVR